MRARLLRPCPALILAAAVAGCGVHGGKGGGAQGGLASPATRLNAAGEAPSWSALVRPGELSLTLGDMAPMTVKATAVDRGRAGAGWRGASPGAPGVVALDVSARPCRDGATGMTYPLTAVAQAQGRRYAGCAAPPGQGLGPRS